MNPRFLLTLLCGTVLFLASCSKGPDYGRLIPSNAIAVVDVNLNEIYKKGDLGHADKLSFVKLLRQELSSEDSKTRALVDDIFDNPDVTGLDLRKDVVFFVDEELNSTLIMTMKSKKKFEKFIQRVYGDEKLDIVKAKGVCRVSDVSLPFSLAWDKKKVMLRFDKRGSVYKQMNIKKEESIASDKDFMTYWNKRGDISVWYRMKALLDIAEEFGDAEAVESVADYRDELDQMSVFCNINFEKGAILFAAEILGVDEDSELMQMQQQKFNDKLLAFMPENTYAVFSMVKDLTQVARILKRIPDAGVFMDKEVAQGVTVADLLSSLGGSVVANLYGFGTDEDGDPRPLFAVAIDIKDASKANEIMAKLELPKRNGLWVQENYSVFLGIRDNVLFATNDSNTASSMQKDGFKDGLGKRANDVKKGCYIFADLNMDNYPAQVQGIFNGRLFGILRQYFDYTELATTSKTSVEWTICLKDKKQNSLAATLHFIDDNLMAFVDMASSVAVDFDDSDEDYFSVDY